MSQRALLGSFPQPSFVDYPAIDSAEVIEIDATQSNPAVAMVFPEPSFRDYPGRAALENETRSN